MAECNVSIDQKKLPGVKEVCRDFAVLEDHCLAYNLQEQEIESHLASNVHKSRLVQQDLQVAKKLQEEEDERAKARSQKQHGDIERQDNEIAHEIQEELVRQAEQQRQQEEKDAAIARKLQEKEMKEERKRQKQMEPKFDADYFEDQGAARRPLDLDRHTNHRHDVLAPVSSDHNDSVDYNSSEPKRSRYPKKDPGASRSRYSEDHLIAESGRSRYADPYPEHLLPSRGKRGDKYPEYMPTEMGRVRDSDRGAERVVRKKERPARPPPPQSPIERHKTYDRDRDRYYDRGRDREWERHGRKDQRRDRDQDLRWTRTAGRDRERSRERGQSADRNRARDRQRQKERDKQRARTRSRDRILQEDYYEGRGHIQDGSREGRASWEEEYDSERERRTKGRQRVQSNPEDVFYEHERDRGREDTWEPWDNPGQGEGPSSPTHGNRETGRIVHRGSGAVIAETEHRLNEATKGMTKLGLRELELKDMEVARKLQEEEIKASKIHSRAAQVAQDEEIARLMMEQEKKEYKKNREKEREQEKERERMILEKMAMERRRQEGEYRPNSEEVVRPRTRDEYEYPRQKNQNKPVRPPQPRVHDYENVNPGYGYNDHPLPPRAPNRPEAAHKGAYYKR